MTISGPRNGFGVCSMVSAPQTRVNEPFWRPPTCLMSATWIAGDYVASARASEAKPCQWSFLPCPEWLELIRNGLRTTNSFSGEHVGRLYCVPQSRANAPLRLSQNGLHVYRMVCSHHITLSLTFLGVRGMVQFRHLVCAPQSVVNERYKQICMSNPLVCAFVPYRFWCCIVKKNVLERFPFNNAPFFSRNHLVLSG